MAETPQETARRRSLERRALTGEGAAEVAREQQPMRQGFRRGFEPSPPARQIGPVPPKPVGPGGLSSGFISSAEQERRRREKAMRGEPLTQEDL